MRGWRTVLIVLIIILFVASSVMVGILLLSGSAGGIYFINLEQGFSWKIDKEELYSFESNFKNANGTTPHVIVLLSPKLVKTNKYAGFGENAPTLYIAWSGFNLIVPWKVLTVYIDGNEWNKSSREKREELLTNFIFNAIDAEMGKDKTGK